MVLVNTISTETEIYSVYIPTLKQNALHNLSHICLSITGIEVDFHQMYSQGCAFKISTSNNYKFHRKKDLNQLLNYIPLRNIKSVTELRTAFVLGNQLKCYQL